MRFGDAAMPTTIGCAGTVNIIGQCGPPVTFADFVPTWGELARQAMNEATRRMVAEAMAPLDRLVAAPTVGRRTIGETE